MVDYMQKLLSEYSREDIAYGVEQKFNWTCTPEDVTEQGIGVDRYGNAGWLTDEQTEDLYNAMQGLTSAENN